MDLEKRGQIGRRNLHREFNGDQEMVARVLAGCLKAVVASRRSCPMRVWTEAEMRRRTDYCVELALELGISMHWSTWRIADTLTHALEIWLKSGTAYEPTAAEHKRAFWGRKAA